MRSLCSCVLEYTPPPVEVAPSKVLTDFVDLTGEHPTLFYDLQVIVQGRSIYCHRLFLKECPLIAPYLDSHAAPPVIITLDGKMNFSCTTLDHSISRKLRILDIEWSSVVQEIFFNYLVVELPYEGVLYIFQLYYIGKVHVPITHVKSIKRVAEELEMNSLVALCKRIIQHPETYDEGTQYRAVTCEDVVTFVTSFGEKNVLKLLSKSFNSDEFSDITFRVHNKVLHAHKVEHDISFSSSPCFKMIC